MVKAYLRYEPADCFGVVASSNSNVVYDHNGKLVITAALENVIVWNPKLGTAVHTLKPVSSGGACGEVTRLARAPSVFVAAGYNDGVIRVWDYVKEENVLSLNGHKTAVTALRYNKSGAILASGGKDTDVVIWDVVGETGLFRLRGHRDQITDVVFVERGNRLVSSSKDSVVRVWDLDTQHCIQTVVGHRGEVWALAVDPQERRLVTGSVDQQLRVYTIANETNQPSAVSTNTLISAVGPSQGAGSDVSSENQTDVLALLGSIQRQTADRVVTLEYDEAGEMLGCHAANKSVELYRVRDEVEAQKRVKRRKKRQREKAKMKEGGKEQEEEEEEEGRKARQPMMLSQLQTSSH